MNLGERDELLGIIRLVQMKEAGKRLPVIGEIKSVGYKGREYGSPPWSYDSGKPGLWLTECDLCDAVSNMGFQKAGRNDKADVYINGLGVSLKSERSAPPALVNHTTRPGWKRICQQIPLPIEPLDKMLAHYWELREAGKIREDIANSDQTSPFCQHREYLKPLLSYFLFKGTGSRDSASPADYLLAMVDPTNESTWTVYSPDEIVDEYWNRLVFSVRSKKGMPPNYPNMSDQALQNSVSLWTKLYQNEYRGALHVRAK